VKRLSRWLWAFPLISQVPEKESVFPGDSVLPPKLTLTKAGDWLIVRPHCVTCGRVLTVTDPLAVAMMAEGAATRRLPARPQPAPRRQPARRRSQ